MQGTAEIHPDKVAVYIRWSTDDQGEGTTLQTQQERCRYYLQSQGWTYTQELVYVDDGYSGGTLERPALARLRADVAQGRVECVVVYKIDRLSRSVGDIVDLVLREWEGRCYVKSASEEINTITPAGKMFFHILISFAEYERNLIRERTMGGKIKRAEQGLNPGFRLPFGYRCGRMSGSIETVPAEGDIVRQLFQRFDRGDSASEIAAALNRSGLLRRSRPWTALAVRRSLENPAYAGVLAYGRTTRTTHEQRRRHGVGSVVSFEHPRYAIVEGAFPPLVDRARWERVQKRLRCHPAGRRTPDGAYLLSGVAVCRCGAPLHGKRAGRSRYYCCSARKRNGPSACDAGHAPAQAVEERVIELLGAADDPGKAIRQTVQRILVYRQASSREAPHVEIQRKGAGPCK